MTTHPIILTPSQLRSALAGRLEQLRMPVVLSDQSQTYAVYDDDGWPCSADEAGDWHRDRCPFGVVGDRLTCTAPCPNLNCEGTGISSAYEPFVCDVCKDSGEVSVAMDITGIRVERGDAGVWCWVLDVRKVGGG